MNDNNIECMSMLPDNTRAWEITADGKLWPYCKIVVDLYPPKIEERRQTLKDKTIMDQIKNNPDWNNLFENSFEDIINHPIYKDYISPDGWKTNTPPVPCMKYCGKIKKGDIIPPNHKDKFIE